MGVEGVMWLTREQHCRLGNSMCKFLKLEEPDAVETKQGEWRNWEQVSWEKEAESYTVCSKTGMKWGVLKVRY